MKVRDALRHGFAAIYLVCIALAVGMAILFAALDEMPDAGWYVIVSGLSLLAIALAIVA